MLIARRRRRRGSVAYLSIHRSVDQVGRLCVSAFHCVATRAVAPACDTCRRSLKVHHGRSE